MQPELQDIDTTRRRGPRGATRLAADPAWQQLLVALSQKIDRLITRRGVSIASYARGARLSESALQDILKARSDPKLSTLYTLGRYAGFQVYVFFESDGRGRASL